MIIVYPVNTVFPSTRANTIQILHTAHALATEGHDVHLIGKKGSVSLEEISEYYGITPNARFNVHLVPAPRILKSAKGHESLVMKRTLQILSHFRSSPKILFTRDPLFASLLLRMKRLFKFRLIYEAHTLFFITAKETYMPVAWNESKEKRIHKREQRVLGGSDGVVFISSSLKDFAGENNMAPSVSTVVHDGTVFPDHVSSRKSSNQLCYSGQFYLWKGMATLLQSMQWVENATLHLYGGGYSTVQDDLKEMHRLISDLNLSGKTVIHDFVSPSQIGSTISQCSIGILPLPKNIIGNRCNSPLKLFDYMANGLAIVASDLLTIREVLHHGVNGHLVAPGDPRSLADGINRVLADSGYRASLAAAARETARKYTWQERARQLSVFFRQVLS